MTPLLLLLGFAIGASSPSVVRPKVAEPPPVDLADREPGLRALLGRGRRDERVLRAACALERALTMERRR